MDSVFGIGLPEFVLIIVIAGMVMGPERILKTARTLGVMTARLQTISRSFLRQLNSELDAIDETGQIKETVEELELLRRQVAELRNDVFTLATGTVAEVEKAKREISHEIEHSILPPQHAAGVSSRSASAGVANGIPSSSPSHQLKKSADPTATQDVIGLAKHNRSSALPLPKRIEIAEDPDA
ncbi:MAG: hypothetical protein M9896_00445 [Candidatus Promineofilum sp.]|uniref:hypothetical protein n=1 Tax=Promineifilum sp. TaxID=2664178 RepID=UPI0024119EC0|nr:hypothetical protein [Promineifilum sp.]